MRFLSLAVLLGLLAGCHETARQPTTQQAQPVAQDKDSKTKFADYRLNFSSTVAEPREKVSENSPAAVVAGGARTRGSRSGWELIVCPSQEGFSCYLFSVQRFFVGPGTGKWMTQDPPKIVVLPKASEKGMPAAKSLLGELKEGEVVHIVDFLQPTVSSAVLDEIENYGNGIGLKMKRGSSEDIDYSR